MEPESSPMPDVQDSGEPEAQEEPTAVQQDGFRKVCFGQASDPLYPPHPGEPESPEDELTRAAMEDPGYERVEENRPTVFRFIMLTFLAVLALGLIFKWLR